ncbi:MAG: hypothetical protein H8E55_71400 [Pelagibacterales bacterium]|nr:hypothetical protein [Pelagibacterales bacterium]
MKKKLTVPHEEYKKYITSYKTVKTSLSKIVKNKVIHEDILNTVKNVNIIITHSYNFLKMYCLKYFEKEDEIPEINQKFIVCIIKTLCSFDSRGRKPNESTLKIMNNLKEFYDDEYSKTINKNDLCLSFTNLSQIMEYEATGILTCLSNHLKNHFYDMFNTYINIKCNKTHIEKGLQSKDICDIRKEIKALKMDILMNTDKCSDKYTKIKKEIRKNIMINFNYKADPILFLLPLMKMSIDGEKILKTKTKKGEMFNIINCFPLRKNITLKYIDIDTVTLVLILMKENKGKFRKDGNIVKLRDEIWRGFIKTNSSVFYKKGYTFNNRISTDGVGCSILFVRDDLYDPFGKVQIKSVRKPKDFSNNIYVDDLSDNKKDQIKHKSFVGIDPGKEDLIFCTSGNTKIIKKENNKTIHKTDTFRYSQNQRRKDTKSKRFMKIIDNSKKETKLKNVSVKKIESELSRLNPNTCNFKNFKKYIEIKNAVNYNLRSYYENELFGKLKWHGFINRQKSDSDMINRFKSVFGDPDKTVVLMGDFEQRQHMKFKEPTKGKSIRDTFKKCGYELYLVDEFRTSCKSFINGNDAETFLIKNNPRPFREGIIKCHGLLRSKIFTNEKSNDEKYVLLNRDFNGSMNILKKGKCIIDGEEIPSYLSRHKTSVT